MSDGKTRGPGPSPRGSQRSGHRSQAGPNRARPQRQREPRKESKYEAVHLSDDVVRELKQLARPGKGDILVKVFADAAAAFAAGDYTEAIALADQSKHIALRSPTVRELLGLSHYQSANYKEAASELTTFRRLSGTTEQNPVIADCYRALKKPEKALEICDEIDPTKVDPAVFFEGQIVAAGALADLKRYDEAIARLERLNLRPPTAEEHHLRAWYFLGSLLEKRGRFSQAREWFEAVVSADPDLTDAAERLKRLT